MMKKLYDWTLSLAASRHATAALAGIAFAESSFFPVPPDALLLVMSLAKPAKAWRYALICTFASVAGGALGYAIGALLFDTVGQWIIHIYGYDAKMEAMREFYGKWGAAFILIKGVLPIPYKLVTITAGIFSYNFPLFILLSLITRGTRFFLFAAALNRFGDQIRDRLESHFGLLMGSLAAIVVGGFVIAVKLF